MHVKDIERAHAALRGVLHDIPVSSSRTFSQMSGSDLFLKCENLQKTGSFKVRGAYNKILSLVRDGNRAQVIAASAGNHAQGVAYSADRLGADAVIVMPEGTPIAKVQATEGYGAKIILHGSCYDDAYAKACDIMAETGAEFVHPFDDEEVIAGQATVAVEILKDIPTADIVLVPAGGGGLLAGIAYYIKQINPRIRVIGVQAEGANAIQKTFETGTLEETETAQTIADGIAVKRPGTITTEYINRYADDVVSVSDDEIAEAILLLLERHKMAVEPAGAASLAAALHGKAEIAGKRIVCLLSGGNIDVSFIQKIVEKGLMTRGRLMKFRTIMPDQPGSLGRFSSLMSECRANIIMVQHDRLSTGLSLSDAILHVACELASMEHGQELVRRLEKAGYEIVLES